MRRIAMLVPLAVLTACSPQDLADSVGRKAASTVVLPVVQQDLPTPMAQKVTDCIVRNASASEIQTLSRDVAVVAGTLTEANIRAIALRPEVQSCIAANGAAWRG